VTSRAADTFNPAVFVTPVRFVTPDTVNAPVDAIDVDDKAPVVTVDSVAGPFAVNVYVAFRPDTVTVPALTVDKVEIPPTVRVCPDNAPVDAIDVDVNGPLDTVDNVDKAPAVNRPVDIDVDDTAPDDTIDDVVS
jgi:hypothetical protein